MSEPLLLDPGSVAEELIAGPPSAPAPSTVEAKPASKEPKEAKAPLIPAEQVKDKSGRFFDPSKHKIRDGKPLINVHGFFMPRGGTSNEKIRQREQAAAGQVGAGAWSAEDKAESSGAPAPADPQKNEASAGGPTQAEATANANDASNDAAEVATRALYFTVGSLINSMDEATPTAAEHENFRLSAAAYFRTLGWKGTALTCFVLRVLAYLLNVAQKPAAAAKVKEWLAEFRAKKKAPRPVEPEANEPTRKATSAPVSIVNGVRLTERPAA